MEPDFADVAGFSKKHRVFHWPTPPETLIKPAPREPRGRQQRFPECCQPRAWPIARRCWRSRSASPVAGGHHAAHGLIPCYVFAFRASCVMKKKTCLLGIGQGAAATKTTTATKRHLE